MIGNGKMAYFNLLASTYTLLTEHYATTHPSLPNYISLIGGDTFGITSNCEDCFINAPSLPDLIEQSGRTWKTYQDDMPEPCFVGSTLRYVQKHNPFIYFDPIRLDAERCARSIVPLTQLDADIALNDLPNFIFITPDICYSAHDCALELADGWLKEQMDKLYPALESSGEPFLIILTWDEGQGESLLLRTPRTRRRTSCHGFHLSASETKLSRRHPILALLHLKNHLRSMGLAHISVTPQMRRHLSSPRRGSKILNPQEVIVYIQRNG